MGKLELDAETAEAAVFGGAVLGGGGGGCIAEGLKLAKLALKLGKPSLINLEELSEEDILLTVSIVGAPAAREQYVSPQHYIRAVELVRENAGVEVRGLISSEIGSLGAVNGWVQAALLGLPVVDAPCDGRAHPTGIMGSMGLHRAEGYLSCQAAVGGREARYLELFVRASLENAAALVRQVSVLAGGMVAVARNPAPASYVKKHGAPGAMRQAIEIGRRMLACKEQGGEKVAQEIAASLGGKVIACGRVEEVKLTTEGGFDRGTVLIGAEGRKIELAFWNEYMTLEEEGRRLATFPDLIANLNSQGTPLSSSEIKAGDEVYILYVPKENLLLGAGLKDLALYRQVEEAIGRPVLKYLERWAELV